MSFGHLDFNAGLDFHCHCMSSFHREVPQNFLSSTVYACEQEISKQAEIIISGVDHATLGHHAHASSDIISCGKNSYQDVRAETEHDQCQKIRVIHIKFNGTVNSRVIHVDDTKCQDSLVSTAQDGDKDDDDMEHFEKIKTARTELKPVNNRIESILRLGQPMPKTTFSLPAQYSCEKEEQDSVHHSHFETERYTSLKFGVCDIKRLSATDLITGIRVLEKNFK